MSFPMSSLKTHMKLSGNRVVIRDKVATLMPGVSPSPTYRAGNYCYLIRAIAPAAGVGTSLTQKNRDNPSKP